MSAVVDPTKPTHGAARLALVTVAFVVVASAAAWASLTGGPSWQGNYRDLPGLARWVLAAISEPQFYAVGSASALLLAGGLIGHIAHHRGWYLQGFVQACGTGIWPSVAGAALLSVVLSALLWGGTLAGGTWQPLSAPLVSVAPAVVALYGPGWRVFLTAAVSGALLGTSGGNRAGHMGRPTERSAAGRRCDSRHGAGRVDSVHDLSPAFVDARTMGVAGHGVCCARSRAVAGAARTGVGAPARTGRPVRGPVLR
ncbi:hypothetical protein [Streptomyces sp. NBC_01198]|uniref:hypothetical protein n=1 Tax=Streptomyces sp. NBC_01198 TaxID=2903769 RepID=UPI002E148D39|nr:hypothetical protein OG702_00170 [Streptomyces sp. NBC_01198]